MKNPFLPGQQITYLALGGDVPHHALLRKVPVEQWDALQKNLTARWKASDDPLTRRRITDLSGCLEKLSATLLQGRRLRRYHDDLLCQAKLMKAGPADAAALRGSEACADFEGLLLQGRAALDRLTWFVSHEFKNPCQSFRRIKNVLADFAEKDKAAAELLTIVTATEPWFDGTFGKLESPHSLRDIVAHHHALIEGTRTCFAVIRVAPDRALLIDCEVQLPGLGSQLPVLKTAHQAIQHIAFLVLNAVGVFLEVPRVGLGEYESLWDNRSVALSEYVQVNPTGSPLGPYTLSTVRRMTPAGLEFGTDNVDMSVFEFAVDL